MPPVRRLGIRENDFLILSVGTVSPLKGQMLLVRTVGRLLAQHPNLPVRLLLVGFDDELHRRSTLSGLSQMERRAVLDGRLLWVRSPEISIFYKSADAFVMNSQGGGENFGRVTIEAMAFGLPILGTERREEQRKLSSTDKPGYSTRSVKRASKF